MEPIQNALEKIAVNMGWSIVNLLEKCQNLTSRNEDPRVLARQNVSVLKSQPRKLIENLVFLW